MVPTAFDEENTVLNPPKGMSAEECSVMSVWIGYLENMIPVTISCWKMTAEELEEITRTGRVWLIAMGHSTNPVSMRGSNPFEEDK